MGAWRATVFGHRAARLSFRTGLAARCQRGEFPLSAFMLHPSSFRLPLIVEVLAQPLFPLRGVLLVAGLAVPPIDRADRLAHLRVLELVDQGKELAKLLRR